MVHDGLLRLGGHIDSSAIAAVLDPWIRAQRSKSFDERGRCGFRHRRCSTGFDNEKRDGHPSAIAHLFRVALIVLRDITKHDTNSASLGWH
jgi:hypothetical protein